MNTIITRFPWLNPMVRRFPGLYQGARRQVERFENMDAGQRRSYQQRRLRSVLQAAGYSPDARLWELPYVTKSDVKANPSRFRRRSLLPSSQGMTSGTNGEPLRLYRSIGSVIFEQATIDWVLAQASHDFVQGRVAVLRSVLLQGVSPFDDLDQRTQGGRVLDLPSNDLSPATFSAFRRALEAFRPQILYVMPTAIEYLADLMIERGATLDVPVVFSSSEVLSPVARRKIKAAFNAECIDYYGQGERVSAAYALRPGEYRFLAASGVTELVTAEDGRREIVGTGLQNVVQPLVRYRTGDLLADEMAPGDVAGVALGLETFRGIAGRTTDGLLGRDGRKLSALDYIPRTLDEYGRFQFVQERPNSVIIQLAGWAPHVKGRIEPVMQRARLLLPEDFDVEVRFVDQLEQNASGKTPFVIWRYESGDA